MRAREILWRLGLSAIAAVLLALPIDAVAADGYVYVVAGSTFNPELEDFSDGGDVLSIWIGDVDLGDGSFGNWRRASSTLGDPDDPNTPNVCYLENSCFIHNGRLYAVSGTNLGGADSTADYVSWFDIDPATGELGAWNRSDSFPTPPTNQRLIPSVAHTAGNGNTYIYLFGGNADEGITDRTLYAQILADGSLGTWDTTTSLPYGAEWFHRVAVVGDHVCMMGGNLTDGPHSYSAPFNADGTLGSWTQQPDFPAGERRWDMATTVANDRIYICGGSGQSAQVFMAEPASGTIGSWTTLASLPIGGRRWPAVSDGSKYLWVIGGRSPGSSENTAVIQRGVIDAADGSVTWDADLALPQDRSFHGAALLVLPSSEEFRMASIERVGDQLTLGFPTVDGITHRLHRRDSMTSGDWAEADFSLSPDGPSMTTFVGDGNPATVFVDPSGAAGFYQAGRDE